MLDSVLRRFQYYLGFQSKAYNRFAAKKNSNCSFLETAFFAIS